MKASISILGLPLIILCFLGISKLSGQLYSLQHFGQEEGISSKIIRAVFQDQEGFLWVGGNKGLFKYDGKKTITHYATPKDTSGLRSDKITSINQTSEGILWVGTDNGLHRRQGKSLIHVPIDSTQIQALSITKLFVDSSDNLWIATPIGLYIMQKTGNSFTFTSVIPNKLIWGINSLPNDDLFVTSSSALFLLKKTDNRKAIKLKLRSSSDVNLSQTYIFDILYLKDSSLICTSNHGLIKTSIIGDTLVNFDRFYDQREQIVSREFIYSAWVSTEDDIWIATWEESFKKYKMIDNQLNAVETTLNTGKSSVSKHVHAVIEDKQSNIWLAAANGLYKLNKSANQFHGFPTNYRPLGDKKALSFIGIEECTDSTLWLAADHTIFRAKKKDLLKRMGPLDYTAFNHPSLDRINKISIDSSGLLWVCSYTGLHIFRVVGNKLLKHKSYTTETGLRHNFVYDIIEYEKGHFIISTYQGLQEIVNFSAPHTLTNEYCSNLYKDSQNQIWLQSAQELSRISLKENEVEIEHFKHRFGDLNSLSNTKVKSIFEDKENRIWIGTQSGVNLYHPKENNFSQFGLDEGLPSDYILGIQEDSNGFLWLATIKGLFKGKYDSTLKKFVDIEHFFIQNGLLDNTSNIQTLLIDSKDNIFVGSQLGLSIRKHDRKIPENFDFNTVISSFQHKSAHAPGFVEISQIDYNSPLQLGHRENSIQLDYIGLDLTRPEFNQYRHKLLPTNDEWIETGNNSTLNFYNLGPNSYKLILDCKNHNGKWQKTPKELEFLISPPWWRSWWAYLLYFISIVVGVREIFMMRVRSRLKKINSEAALNLALVNQRETLRSENAADFHDELGSNLTKIGLYLTLAERHTEDKNNLKAWLEKIRLQTDELSQNFRDLLWIIDPKKDHLSALFYKLQFMGNALFEASNTNFHIQNLSEESYTLEHFWIDSKTKKQINLLLKEALNNVAKYSKASDVILSLNCKEKQFDLSIVDNGIGFSSEQSEGRGIQNMRQRAMDIKAELVISSSSRGTKIKLLNIPHMDDNKIQNHT